MYHRLDYFIASIYKTRHLLQNVNVLWVTNLPSYLVPNQQLHFWDNYIYPLRNKCITILLASLPPANEVAERYYFHRACVILSMGRVCLLTMPWAKQTPTPGMHPPFLSMQLYPSRHALLRPHPLNRILRDTVIKRAVRILLEYILVQVRFLPAAMA